MSSTKELLADLASGDDEAANRVFVVFEPYLRMVLRRQFSTSLRSKFDSTDVVQSVWADLLDGFRNRAWKFDSEEQLRAFLVRAAKNRFIDHVRRNERALRYEQPTASLSTLPNHASGTPSEQVHADDLWGRLMSLCPPQHRQLLQLKRQGLPLADIAERTGLHPSSVRRILYELASRLALANSSISTNRLPLDSPVLSTPDHST
jgi:RNA polymerase sigma-70 factor (ECF subfamily)